MIKYIIYFISIIILIILIIACDNRNRNKKKHIQTIPIYKHEMYYKYLIDHNRNTTQNNIVITFTLNYRIEILQSFFESLRCHSPQSELLIFTDQKTWKAVKNYYPDNKGHAIIITNTYPYYPVNDSEFPIDINDIRKLIPTHYDEKWKYFYATIRYFLFNAWIKYYGSKYSQILTTDCRDVVFQSDPFNWIKKDGLHLQAEFYIKNGKSGIKADHTNMEWIEPFHPPDSIMSHQIINGGEMLGTFNEISLFLNEFTTFLLNSKIIANDQASLNYFYYTHSFKYKVYVHGFKLGYAYNYHVIKHNFPKSFYQPVNNYILNRDNSIPPILHGEGNKVIDVVIKYHSVYCFQEAE